MKIHFHLIAASLIIVHAVNAQQLEQFGLANKTVTAMHEFFGTLYVATQDSGVYRHYLADPDSGWISLGAPAKDLTSIFAFQTVCPFVCWKGILVGAVPEPTASDSTLIYFYQQYPDTCQREGKWVAADSGIDRAIAKQINALTGTAVCQSVGPEFVTAFAAAKNSIWRSYDRGKSWQMVWRWQGVPELELLTIVAYNRSNIDMTQEEIWAGGYLQDGLNPQRPFILHSLDSGDSWEIFDLFPAYAEDEACYALAVGPANTEIVYAALTTAILKSIDQGKSWTAVFADAQARFTSIRVNPQQPNHVLAGGFTGDNIYLLYESFNDGETWKILYSARAVNGVSSMVFDPFIARDPPPLPQRVYLGTLGTGVFRYTLTPTQVNGQQNLPNDFRFEPSFANPGRLTEISAFTFRVDTPSADVLNIRLYNTLGQQVGFWRMHVPGGEQNLTLPLASSSLSAGIYFVQAEWRNRVIVKKWTALR